VIDLHPPVFPVTIVAHERSYRAAVHGGFMEPGKPRDTSWGQCSPSRWLVHSAIDGRREGGGEVAVSHCARSRQLEAWFRLAPTDTSRPTSPPEPIAPDWVHEIKHDGYRVLVGREGVAVTGRCTIEPPGHWRPIGGYKLPMIKLADRYMLSAWIGLAFKSHFSLSGKLEECRLHACLQTHNNNIRIE
jgi:hypothetical protein